MQGSPLEPRTMGTTKKQTHGKRPKVKRSGTQNVFLRSMASELPQKETLNQLPPIGASTNKSKKTGWVCRIRGSICTRLNDQEGKRGLRWRIFGEQLPGCQRHTRRRYALTEWKLIALRTKHGLGHKHLFEPGGSRATKIQGKLRGLEPQANDPDLFPARLHISLSHSQRLI